MVKLKKHISILTLLLNILFICTACEEKYDDVTYYKTIGVGYVFIYDSTGNLQPVQGAIEVTTSLDGWGLFGPPTFKEVFTIDKTGRYQVRFVKRTQLLDATLYSFEFNRLDLGSNYATSDFFPQFSPDDIVNAPKNVVLIDTMKFFKYY